MRSVLARFIVAAGFLPLACATATEEEMPNRADDGSEEGGSSGSAGVSGSTNSAGRATSDGGKAGAATTGFGGTSSNGGAASAGASSGGKAGSGGSTNSAGSSSGGKAAGGAGGGGSASGGVGTAGSSTAGSSSGGTPSTVCEGVPDWSEKAYAIGDTVASTCNGAFAAPCAAGEAHKFECSPEAGQVALNWCQSREPGVGNGWGMAWVDKGKCQ